MPRSNKLITNFAGGEVSPRIHARFDIPLFQKAVARLENFLAQPQGAASYRPGTNFVNYSKLSLAARVIPFQFSDSQAYIIELTDQRMRFFKDEAAITEATKTITGLDEVGTFTSAAHGYSDGDCVFLDTISGPDTLNGQFYYIAESTANTYTLQDVFGNRIVVADLPDYVSGGTTARVYEISTPYLEADLDAIQFAQSADTMYLVHRSYAPRKLTRSGHTNWTLSTYARTADPFGSADNYPGAVCFLDSGRLLMAGTNNNPETFWASRSPQSGATDYDDYTLGASPTHAIKATLASVNGKVDSIQWLAATSKFAVAGCFGSIRLLSGNTLQEAISPISIQAKPANNFGCERITPIVNGLDLFYIQRGKRIMRNLEYDFTQDWYATPDRNLVTDHLTQGLYKQIVAQQGQPDFIWGLLENGKLISLTYNAKEDISAWHRHFIGGRHVDTAGLNRPWAKVKSLAIMSRSSGYDQLWMVVQRTINGNTVYSIEFMSDAVDYPIRGDYYEYTQDEFDNVLYESQKDANHLDMVVAFDASSEITAGTITVGTSFRGFNETGELYAYAFGPNSQETLFRFDNLGGVTYTHPTGTAAPATYDYGGVVVDGVNSIVYLNRDDSKIVVQQGPGSGSGVGPFIPGAEIAYPAGYEFSSYYWDDSMCLTDDGAYLYLPAMKTATSDVHILKIETATGNLVATSPTLGVNANGSLKMRPDEERLYFVTYSGAGCSVLEFTAQLEQVGSTVTDVDSIQPSQWDISDDGTKICIVGHRTGSGANVYTFVEYDTETRIASTAAGNITNTVGMTYVPGSTTQVLVSPTTGTLISKYTASTGALVTSYDMSVLNANDGGLCTVYGMKAEPKTGLIYGMVTFSAKAAAFVLNLNTGTFVREMATPQTNTFHVDRIVFPTRGGL